MAKPTTNAAPAAPVAPVAVQYAPGKYAPKAQTKWGAGNGNATTFAAICAAYAANGNSLTLVQAQAVCLAQAHKGWLAYGLRHKYLVPVAPPVA